MNYFSLSSCILLRSRPDFFFVNLTNFKLFFSQSKPWLTKDKSILCAITHVYTHAPVYIHARVLRLSFTTYIFPEAVTSKYFPVFIYSVISYRIINHRNASNTLTCRPLKQLAPLGKLWCFQFSFRAGDDEHLIGSTEVFVSIIVGILAHIQLMDCIPGLWSLSRSRKKFCVESESVHFYRLRLRPRYKTLNRYYLQ
jgi:hypothetical protein